MAQCCGTTSLFFLHLTHLGIQTGKDRAIPLHYSLVAKLLSSDLLRGIYRTFSFLSFEHEMILNSKLAFTYYKIFSPPKMSFSSKCLSQQKQLEREHASERRGDAPLPLRLSLWPLTVSSSVENSVCCLMKALES